MNPRNQIKKSFNVDLPISGGTGNSKENAVIIEATDSSGISIEYEYLKYIHASLGINYKIIEQSNFEDSGRHYDKIKVEIEGDKENYYNHYFDITNFFGK